jgi:enterochelin esterase-like enzyme
MPDLRSLLALPLLATAVTAAAALTAPSTAAAQQCTAFAWNNPSQSYPTGVTHHTFRSPSMNVDVGFNVYTPPGYATSTQRYPVIYYLHGRGGHEGTMVANVVSWMRTRVQAGLVRNAILVFVNGAVDSFYADAKDGSVQVHTAILDELIPHVDATWRTRACREQRAISGFSMGGHGALLYAFERPQTFGSVVAYAPALVGFGGTGAAAARCMFDNDQAYYDEYRPETWATRNAARLRTNLGVRITVGSEDSLRIPDEAMAQQLTSLAIPHAFEIVPGCDHNHGCLWTTAGDRGVATHEANFGTCGSRPVPNLDREELPPDVREADEASAPAAPAAGRLGRAELANAAAGSVNCGAFAVTGAPSSATGATWTYASIDDGVAYSLKGILLAPAGAGPFPAIVVSHGKGGSARGYSARIGQTMRGWGAVIIATNYSHGTDSAGDLPLGPQGASAENVLRAHKAFDLLRCVASVDRTRVAAHGNSMGAFVTSALLGAFPTDFKVASHTAGGVFTADGQPDMAPTPAQVQGIRTPYQLHHGDADTVVPLAMDQALDAILTTLGVPHQLHVYPGVDHGGVALHATVLSRVRTWYTNRGLLP